LSQLSEIITSSLVVVLSEINSESDGRFEGTSDVGGEVLGNGGVEDGSVVLEGIDGRAEEPDEGVNGVFTFRSEGGDFLEELDEFIDSTSDVLGSEVLDEVVNIAPGIGGISVDADDELLSGSVETEVVRETEEEEFSVGGVVLEGVLVVVHDSFEEVQDEVESSDGMGNGAFVEVRLEADLGKLSEIVTSSFVVLLLKVNSESDGGLEGSSDVGSEVLGNGSVEDGSVVLVGIDGRAEKPDEGVNSVLAFRFEGFDGLEELDEFIDGTGDVLGLEVVDEVGDVVEGIGSIGVDANDEFLSGALETEVVSEAFDELFSVGGVVHELVGHG
jgi:hypothetical protein